MDEYLFAIAYRRHQLLLAGAFPHEHETVDLFILLAIAATPTNHGERDGG